MSGETGVTGAAGTYFVAAELSLRGWYAVPTWGGMPRTDILAQSLEPAINVSIQVKTRWSGSKFELGIGAEEPAKPGLNEWFVLVWTHGYKGVGQRPDYYVVPRDHVSALVYMGHRAYLAERKHGRRHKDTRRRLCEPDHFTRYQEAWDLLDRPPRKAPWRLPSWLWDHVDKYGLPEGHPGLGRRRRG